MFFEQSLYAQQPFPLLNPVSEPGNYASFTDASNDSKQVSPIDKSMRRLASIRSLPNIQDAETIREAIEMHIEDVEQVNHNPPPTKVLPAGGINDKDEPRKGKDRPGSSFLPTLKPIGEIDINIAAKPKANDSSVPPNITNIDHLSTPVRDTTFAFDRTAMYGTAVNAIAPQRDLVAYQPLYFEEVNLERYGRARRGQCVCSMVRFFGTVPMLPYFMTINHPNETMYWNWPYEAGWGAPRVRELPPFSWKAAAVQALAVTGAAAVIP